jgi:hypothetical protein
MDASKLLNKRAYTFHLAGPHQVIRFQCQFIAG